jgi:nitrogen fixation NifU-like protein
VKLNREVAVVSASLCTPFTRPIGMPLDEDELYQERILDHYEEPFHRGHCPAATHAHEDENPLCGDTVRVELAIERDGTIRDAYFDGDGCCISQASASMLIEQINGKRIDDIKAFTAQNMLNLFGAKLTPNRQKCCLLPWRALQSAIYSPLAADGPAGRDRGSDEKR